MKVYYVGDGVKQTDQRDRSQLREFPCTDLRGERRNDPGLRATGGKLVEQAGEIFKVLMDQKPQASTPDQSGLQVSLNQTP